MQSILYHDLFDWELFDSFLIVIVLSETMGTVCCAQAIRRLWKEGQGKVDLGPRVLFC